MDTGQARSEGEKHKSFLCVWSTYEDKTTWQFNYLIIGGHHDLLATQLCSIVRAGLVGGVVYVAETKQDGIVGTAVWFGPDQELLASSIERVDQEVSGLEEKLGGLRDEMQSLKVDLYARFGRSINLEV